MASRRVAIALGGNAINQALEKGTCEELGCFHRLPTYIEGYGCYRPYNGLVMSSVLQKEGVHITPPAYPNHYKTRVATINDALEMAGIKYGMTSGFHHQLCHDTYGPEKFDFSAAKCFGFSSIVIENEKVYTTGREVAIEDFVFGKGCCYKGWRPMYSRLVLVDNVLSATKGSMDIGAIKDMISASPACFGLSKDEMNRYAGALFTKFCNVSPNHSMSDTWSKYLGKAPVELMTETSPNFLAHTAAIARSFDHMCWYVVPDEVSSLTSTSHYHNPLPYTSLATKCGTDLHGRLLIEGATVSKKVEKKPKVIDPGVIEDCATVIKEIPASADDVIIECEKPKKAKRFSLRWLLASFNTMFLLGAALCLVFPDSDEYLLNILGALPFISAGFNGTVFAPYSYLVNNQYHRSLLYTGLFTAAGAASLTALLFEYYNSINDDIDHDLVSNMSKLYDRSGAFDAEWKSKLKAMLPSILKELRKPKNKNLARFLSTLREGKIIHPGAVTVI